jgi:antitoxin component YwqK of YwqJK toxin-antitoxin module
MKNLLFVVTALIVYCGALLADGKMAVEPVAKMLKPKQPNWKPKIVETFPEGNPAKVIFYETQDDGLEHPVKQVCFYANSQIRIEADLCTVAEDSQAYQELKTTAAPHGVAISFFPDGKMERVAFYDQGILHGEMRLFHQSGALKTVCSFSQGKKEGQFISYYEDGKKMEEATYENDKIIGDHISYHPNEMRAFLTPYVDGLMHGTALEWYSTGALKSTKQLQKGVLHSDGKNSAVVAYSEDHAIQEVQDYDQGAPIGTHVKYHLNGKEKYRMPYKNGKKEGKEKFFSTEGKLIGEGEYRHGIKVGTHWRNHENGVKAYEAAYNDKGDMLSHADEFDDQGHKLVHFMMVDDKREGEYFEWYANGQLRVACNYLKGDFEGEQKEYFFSGQIKCRTFYQNKAQHGPYEEWYEDGKQKYVGEFVQGKKEKLHREWSPSGELLFEGSFVEDAPDGMICSWYSKDKLKERAYFQKGKRNGKQEEYYSSGQLKAKGFYKDDLIEGKIENWYEDGALHSVKNFNQGQHIGDQKEYYPKDGKGSQKLARFYIYNDQGKLEGDQKTFYPDGVTQTLAAYKNGELHGMKALWDPQGNLIEESWYEGGKLHGRYFEKTRDGKEIVFHYKDNRKEGVHEIYYPARDAATKVKALQANFVADRVEGEVLEFNEAGQKISTTFYIKGLKEGIAEIVNPQGQLVMSFAFQKDKKSGPAIHYFPNGKIAKEVFFIDDVKDGEEKSYFENGKLASLTQFQAGKEEGISRNWNKDGVLVFEGEYRAGLRHGKFNKYYDDGSPRLLQQFVDDQLDGSKKSYDELGRVTETKYKLGKKA